LAQAVGSLLCKSEALSSILSLTKKKKKKKKVKKVNKFSQAVASYFPFLPRPDY
jgi:hypothetical protein